MKLHQVKKVVDNQGYIIKEYKPTVVKVTRDLGAEFQGEMCSIP